MRRLGRPAAGQAPAGGDAGGGVPADGSGMLGGAVAPVAGAEDPAVEDANRLGGDVVVDHHVVVVGGHPARGAEVALAAGRGLVDRAEDAPSTAPQMRP